MQLWVVRPVKVVVALAALVVVTFLAGALRPKLLYAANGIGNIEHTKRPVFLNYRSFVLSELVLFQLIANQSLVDLLKKAKPELQSIPGGALEVLLLLILFLVIAIGALQVWVGARWSKARLSMSQSMKVSGYGLGTLYLGILVLVLIGLMLANVISAFFPSPPTIVWEILGILLIFLIFISLAYISFVGPVSAYHPGASRVRLWLGWSMGSLLILVACVMIFLLVLLVGSIVSMFGEGW